MDSVRYFFALVLLISLPPAILPWVIIHPFAGFWRRLGPVWTYSLLGLPMAILMVGLYLARTTLLAVEFGTRPPLIVLAILVFVGSVVIAVRRRRQLGYGTLAGLPEISRKRYPGKLLTDGVYAHVRHPRYVEVFFGILAYALLANYLASYVIIILSIPALYLVVVLEERELRQRFGGEYEDYARRVPRFFPRIRRRE